MCSLVVLASKRKIVIYLVLFISKLLINFSILLSMRGLCCKNLTLYCRCLISSICLMSPVMLAMICWFSFLILFSLMLRIRSDLREGLVIFDGFLMLVIFVVFVGLCIGLVTFGGFLMLVSFSSGLDGEFLLDD